MQTALTHAPEQYEFHFDAGHGWLRVPIADIRRLGVSPSAYSYLDAGQRFAYLEEDCDASKFVEAYEAAHGSPPLIREIDDGSDSPIREMDKWRGVLVINSLHLLT